MREPLKFSIELCPPLKPDSIGSYYEKFKFLLKLTNLVSLSSHAGDNGRISGFERSFNLAEYLLAQQHEFKLDVLFHVTCRDLDRSNIASRLEKLKRLGIERILVISGENYTVPLENESKKYFVNSTELVYHIMKHFKCQFRSIAVGGYPNSKNLITQLDNYGAADSYNSLCRKVSLGADTIYTQCIFNLDDFKQFREKIIERIGPKIEIVPSVAIFSNHQSLQKCLRLLRVKADDDFQRELERVEFDKVEAYCKNFIVKLCKALRDIADCVDEITINICAFGLFDLVADITEAILDLSSV